MDALKVALSLAALTLTAPASGEAASANVMRWHPIIADAAQRFGIPEGWIERVMRAESAGMTELDGHPIRSHAGAIGLMQLMPATWATMRESYHLGADPDDPRDNIIAGAAFLRRMYDRFGYPELFAAYNAGPQRCAAYLAGRARLPAETIGYLAGVTRSARPADLTPVTPPPQLLFALRHDLAAPDRSANARPEDGLFAVRKDGP